MVVGLTASVLRGLYDRAFLSGVLVGLVSGAVAGCYVRLRREGRSGALATSSALLGGTALTVSIGAWFAAISWCSPLSEDSCLVVVVTRLLRPPEEAGGIEDVWAAFARTAIVVPSAATIAGLARAGVVHLPRWYGLRSLRVRLVTPLIAVALLGPFAAAVPTVVARSSGETELLDRIMRFAELRAHEEWSGFARDLVNVTRHYASSDALAQAIDRHDPDGISAALDAVVGPSMSPAASGARDRGAEVVVDATGRGLVERRGTYSEVTGPVPHIGDGSPFGTPLRVTGDSSRKVVSSGGDWSVFPDVRSALGERHGRTVVGVLSFPAAGLYDGRERAFVAAVHPAGSGAVLVVASLSDLEFRSEIGLDEVSHGREDYASVLVFGEDGRRPAGAGPGRPRFLCRAERVPCGESDLEHVPSLPWATHGKDPARTLILERVTISADDPQVVFDARVARVAVEWPHTLAGAAQQSTVASSRDDVWGRLHGTPPAMLVVTVHADPYLPSTRSDLLRLSAVMAIVIAVLGLLLSTLSRFVLRQGARLSRLFAQYVPDTVARQLTEREGLESSPGERADVSLLFCDLRDFTPLAGSLTPDQVRDLLNVYYGHASRIALGHGGTLVQYVGDEVFVVFGAPEAMADHAEHALSCARELIASAPQLRLGLAEKDLPPVAYGVGAHSGLVVAAHVGDERRRQFAVVGDPVNVAARLCSAAGGGEAVVSGDLLALVRDPPACEELAGLHLKGVQRAIRTFKLTVELPDPV